MLFSIMIYFHYPSKAEKFILKDNFFNGLKSWNAGQFEDARNYWATDANLGDIDAQYNLATLYENGTGLKKNKNIAAKLYAEAAKRNFPEAAIRLIKLKQNGYAGNIPIISAVNYLKKNAKNGSAQAQYTLAKAYDIGLGVTQNFSTAALWYKKAANQGIAEAQYNLGSLLEDGLGIFRDPISAHKWYLKAASNGISAAQNNIGYQYQHGLGIGKNLKISFAWYKKSARAGNHIAQNNLGIMYQYGYGTSRNLKNAIYWFRKAALNGDANAQNSLGLMIVNGLGIEREPIKAMTWFILAVKSKDIVSDHAKLNMDKLKAQLSESELQKAQHRANKIHKHINNFVLKKHSSFISPIMPFEIENKVIGVQRHLRFLGFYEGKVDGILGSATSEAILRFRQENNLEISNKVDSKLIYKLRDLIKKLDLSLETNGS